LDFATLIFFKSKVVSFASNPQSGGPGPCIYVPPVTGWPSYTPSLRVPFSSLRRTALEIFQPASTRDQPEDGGNIFLRNVSKLLPNFTALQHRKPNSLEDNNFIITMQCSVSLSGGVLRDRPVAGANQTRNAPRIADT
jgi:hypothetical protein